MGVHAGTLHLGAVRTSYGTQISLQGAIRDLALSGAFVGAFASGPTYDEVAAQVQKAFANQTGVEEDRVYVKCVAASGVSTANCKTQNPLGLQVDFISPGNPAVHLPSWDAKLHPVARNITKYFQNKFAPATTHYTPSNFNVMVGPASAKNAVDTINMDFVIHGIDYQDVVPARRSAFVMHLAEAVRNGFDWTYGGTRHIAAGDPPVLTPAERKDIHVTISNHVDSDNAVNVRAKIDAPTDPVQLAALIKNLERAQRGRGTAHPTKQPSYFKESMTDAIKKMPGVDYVSTWLASEITVSMPGEIEDFAGDKTDGTDRT